MKAEFIFLLLILFVLISTIALIYWSWKKYFSVSRVFLHVTLLQCGYLGIIVLFAHLDDELMLRHGNFSDALFMFTLWYAYVSVILVPVTLIIYLIKLIRKVFLKNRLEG